MDIAQSCQQQLAEINSLIEERQKLRNQEKNLRLREQVLSSRPILKGGASLTDSLRRILPARLVPGNVGEVNQTAWPFYYAFDFDFGVDPVLSAATRQTRQIIVSQEAGFIMTAASVAWVGGDQTASFRAPWQFTVRDNQSTRQLNDVPIRVADLGWNGQPTELYTGYLLVPNGSISMEVSTFIEPGVTMPTIGDGRFQISIFGVRVRVEDFDKVMTTTFQR